MNLSERDRRSKLALEAFDRLPSDRLHYVIGRICHLAPAAVIEACAREMDEFAAPSVPPAVVEQPTGVDVGTASTPVPTSVEATVMTMDGRVVARLLDEMDGE